MMELFNRSPKKLAIIAGCGRFGISLALICDQDKYDVVLIDKDENNFHLLPDSLNYNTVVGDATDSDILEKAGILHADMVIAATGSDNANIMIAQLAKLVYKVNESIAFINDVSRREAYDNNGIQVICPLTLSLHEFTRILTA